MSKYDALREEVIDLRKKVYHLRWVLETILKWVSYPEKHHAEAIKNLCKTTLKEK